MATLEKIRNRSGLLVAVIAFGLFVFIVGDFLKGGSSMLGSGSDIAKVNGTSIELSDYQDRVNELTEVYKVNSGANSLDEQTTDQVYTQVWEGILRENILYPQLDKLGLSVCEEELFDRVQGENLDPIIQQMFRDPNSGQVDKSQVVNYLKSINAQGGTRLAHWLFYERMIKENRLNAKFNNLISKGLYVTTQEASFIKSGADVNKSIEFIKLEYSSIADSLVEVSDSEIKSYYNKHIDEYEQDETREIEYITFPIVASQADYKGVEQWSNEIKTELEVVNGVSEVANFVKLNSDDTWDQARTSKEATAERFKEFAFDSEVGAVYGPYFENETYKVVKLVSREERSDSVRASHILIQGENPTEINALSDSLLEVVKKSPRKFADLAKKFSKDPGSAAKGGDLGWFKEGMMVPEFNDACFDGKKGDIVKVSSQFGVHIIKVDAKGKPLDKVQLATVTRKVEPSTETYRNIYAEASKFIGTHNNVKSFKTAVEEDESLKMQKAFNVGKNEKRVNGLTKARELVQWAFRNDAEELSTIMEMSDNFVIAYVSKVNKEGAKPLSSVKATIRRELLNEKKAELLTAKINGALSGSKSLSSLSQKLSVDLLQAENINFSAYQVNAAGREPALIGAVSEAKKDVLAGPVVGESGVFMFRVTSELAATDIKTIEETKQFALSSFQYRVGYQSYNALREKADITDYRYKFY